MTGARAANYDDGDWSRCRHGEAGCGDGAEQCSEAANFGSFSLVVPRSLGFVGARAGETCKFWSGNFAARKSWNGNCGNIGVECAPVLIHREQPAAKAVQEMNFQLAGKVQAAKQKAAAAARAGAQAEAPEALTAWQEKARQQATQDRLAAEERRKQKQKEVTEGAAAEEWLRELDSKMAKLEMKNWAAPKSEAKKIRSIVQSVNPNSKFLAQPEKDRIIEGDVRMNATRVDIQEEKAQSTQLGLLRAREMVSNLAEATGRARKAPGTAFPSHIGSGPPRPVAQGRGDDFPRALLS